MILSKFKLDRSKNILHLKNDLMSFIDEFSNEKRLNAILKIYSENQNLSFKNTHFEVKQFLFKNFVNNKGAFDNKFELKKILKYSIIYLSFLFYVLIFSKTKKTKIINYDIIVDNNTEFTNLKRFEILNEKSRLLFITSQKSKEKKFKTYFFNYKRCIIDNKIYFIKNNLNFFFLFLKISLISRNNIIPFLYHLCKINLKYNTIFSEVSSKYLIQERFYDTSALRDSIFHSKGGIYSSCFQKNLFQINGPGMYVSTDILFTLGKKSILYDKEMGCMIKKKVPVGSWCYERSIQKHHGLSGKKIYDLLVFASEHIANFHSGYDNYYQEYYKHFEWIKKFAIKFPKLKICIKHKKTFNDKKENSILEGIPNVVYVVDYDDDHSDSYVLGEKAKALCTWSSTLGYELIGSGKTCYFLDPNNSNFSFLPKNEINDLVRVTSYQVFEKKILKLINGESDFTILAKKEDFCLSSENVSQNILNFFQI